MLDRLFRTDPILSATGLAMLFCIPPTVLALALDPRLFEGQPVWLKPLKFEIALAIYLLTLAYFARWMPEPLLKSRRYRVYAGIVAFTVVGEVLWIGGAAANATASHYNYTEPFLEAIYPVMGLFAITLTSASAVYGWRIWRNDRAGLDPAMRRALGLGLILTFVLTVIAAGILSSQPGHFVGTPETGAVLPILGWSREVGDLRVAHFLATHAMHVIPLAGLVLLALPGPVLRRRAVTAVAVGYVALVVLTLVQALRGMPLI